MLLYLPNETHKHVIFFDTEFEDQKLVQVAMILYESVRVNEVDAYLLKGSINLYIKREVNNFFVAYTNITNHFLEENGIEEEEVKNKLNSFLCGLNNNTTLFVAHGIKQDMTLLLDFGINIDKVDRYCTYNNSKALLKRDSKLKLDEICNESGYFLDSCHDAYSDAKNVVHAFSFLRLIEATAM